MHLHRELQICTDCLLLIANGEGPEDAEAHAALLYSKLGELLRHTHAGDDEKDRGFSWSPCEGCGSDLGGDRHHAVILCEHPECAPDSELETPREEEKP